jgi:hypothetical protein
VIDAVKPIRGRVGRPRKHPKRLIADRGYDHDKYRQELWKRGMHQFRRLRIRWERDPQMHLAFLHLACALICWRRLSAS